MSSAWFTAASLSAASAVGFGAFGAHGLKSRGIPDAKIANWGVSLFHPQTKPIVLIRPHRQQPTTNSSTPWRS